MTRRPAAVVRSPEPQALHGRRSNFDDPYRAFRERHSPNELAFDLGFFDSLRDRRTVTRSETARRRS